jgi:uncharacterized repeat protein (TIGR01451 family)
MSQFRWRLPKEGHNVERTKLRNWLFLPLLAFLSALFLVIADRSAGSAATPPITPPVLFTPTPAVQISKVDSPDPVAPGDLIHYTIVIRNVTTATVASLWLQDAIPPNTTFDEASDGGAVSDSGIVTWDLGQLNAGASRTVYVSVSTQPGTPDGTVLTNRAVVSYHFSSGLPEEVIHILTSSASASTTVQRPYQMLPTPTPLTCGPDEAGNSFYAARGLTAGFGSMPAILCPSSDEDWFQFPVNVGDSVRVYLDDMAADFDLDLYYPDESLAVRDNKTGTVSGVYSVAPQGKAGDWRARVYAHAGTGAMGYYYIRAMSLAPTRTPMPPTATRTPSNTRTPTATATGTRTPAPTATRTVTRTPTRTPAPALQVSTSFNGDYLVAGEEASYTIRVQNTGSTAAHNVVIKDELPQRASYVRATPAATYVADEHRVQWNAATLAANSSQYFYVTVLVIDTIHPGDSLHNQVNVTADGVSNIHVDLYNEIAAPDLDLVPNIDTDNVVAGATVQLSASTSNAGPGRAQDVRLRYYLDAHMLNPRGHTGAYDSATNSILWTLDDILPGRWGPSNPVDVDIDPDLALGTVLHTRWKLEAAGVDDLVVPYDLTVDQASPDVSVDWTLSDDVLGLGDSSTINITVHQHSSYTLHNMELHFEVPSDEFDIARYPDNCAYGPAEDHYYFVCYPSGQRGDFSTSLRVTVRTDFIKAPGSHILPLWVEADEMADYHRDISLTVAPDLTIDGLEISQSIQRYPENDVALIRGRKTWVRVYAKTDIAPVRDVTCRLHTLECIGGDCYEIGILNPVDDHLTVNKTYNQAYGYQSFIFGVFQEWTEYGDLAFIPEINWDRSVVEDNYDNNFAEDKMLRRDFPRQSSTLIIEPILGQYIDPATDITYSASLSDLDDDVTWLRQALPFEGVDFWDMSPVDTIFINWWDLSEDAPWEAALDWLADLHDDDGAPTHWELVLPYLPPSYGDGDDDGYAWGGVARVDGRDMIVVPYGNEHTAHEYGHNTGLLHPYGCNAGGPFDHNNPIDLEGYGLNPETLEIYPPSTYTDIMTYCSNRWITRYSYDHMYRDVAGGSVAGAEAAAVATPQPGLLVAGRLNVDAGTGTIRRSELGEWMGAPFNATGSGPYSIELRDGGGALLFTRFFTPALNTTDGNGTGSVSYSYREFLPPQAGLASITLKHGAQTLASRTLSANAPTVTLLAPNGGEVITGTFTASWQASDLDGDALTYALQYSVDGGQTWMAITRGLTETTHTLSGLRLPGASHARLRVVASDGVLTARDVSDADFAVPNHAPQVRITRPEDGSRVRFGALTYLAADAHDKDQQGIVNQVQWRSDKDGILATGREIGVISLTVGIHAITAVVTDMAGMTASDSITLVVLPPIPSANQCTDRLSNGDFEDTGWGGWSHGGSPEPAVVQSVTGTNHALLLGNPAGAQTAAGQPGLLWVRQTIDLPQDSVRSTLSFSYTVGSKERGEGYDWFVAALTNGDGEVIRVLEQHGGQSPWQSVTADLSDYEGQTVSLLFAVRNDGQAGDTWAYVDNVSLCVSAPPPVEIELDGSWLSSAADKAPSGLPDFDQRQSTWTVPATEQWSHDAPAAVADLLWWQDSVAESAAGVDGRLVESYGVWDDHDAQNAVPLVRDLATQLNTNGSQPGSDLDDVASGLSSYLTDRGLAGDYSLAIRRQPSLDWVRDEVKQDQAVLLLLGFWERQPGGWKRLGGHYVAAAGVGSGSADWIAFSDPLRDGAETGQKGRVLPATAHNHPLIPPDGVHNNAAFVSHDIYGIVRTSTGWGPQGYARTYASIANFAGLNFAPALEDARAGAYLQGEIVTLVDYVVVIEHNPGAVLLTVSPTSSRLRAGETFIVEMGVHAGSQAADGVQAFLSFDPAVLQVVDENGQPAGQIIPGPVLTTVLTNAVNNTAGVIVFAAQGEPQDGRFLAASARFRAVTTTLASALQFSVSPTRTSDVTYMGTSLLDQARGGVVTVLPGARVAGHVDMERPTQAPDPSWQVPLLLTLSRAGERGPDYVLSTSSTITGAFAAPGIVAPGAYRVRLSGIHTLRNVLPVTITPGLNILNLGTLLEGDSLNDNRVDMRDLSLVAAAYGKTQGQAGFDPRADFNEDNTISNGDVSLLRPNLGRRGDVLVQSSPAAGVGLESPSLDLVLPEDALAAGSVSLYISPTTTTTRQGNIVTLRIVAAAGAQPVDTAQVFLDFDPAALQIVDEAGQAAGEITPGGALPAVYDNHVDAGRGWISYLASSLGTAANGDVTIATLRVKVLAAGQTWLRFSFNDWRVTELAYEGQSVLAGVRAAHIQATAAFRLSLPVILK